MSTIYFIFGFCQAVIGYDAIIFWKQEHFVIDYSKYNNIGTNPKKIVVYFSRMGYTKTIALQKANKTGAVLYELKTTKKQMVFQAFGGVVDLECIAGECH